jgi:hypothetical protein
MVKTRRGPLSLPPVDGRRPSALHEDQLLSIASEIHEPFLDERVVRPVPIEKENWLFVWTGIGAAHQRVFGQPPQGVHPAGVDNTICNGRLRWDGICRVTYRWTYQSDDLEGLPGGGERATSRACWGATSSTLFEERD